MQIFDLALKVGSDEGESRVGNFTFESNVILVKEEGPAIGSASGLCASP